MRWSIFVGALLASACAADVEGSGDPLLEELAYVDDRVEPDSVLRVTSFDEVDVATMTLRVGDTHLDVFVEAVSGWELGDAVVAIGNHDVYVELGGSATFDVTDGVSFVHLPIPLEKVELAPGDFFKLALRIQAREPLDGTESIAAAVGGYRLGELEPGLHAVCCLDG